MRYSTRKIFLALACSLLLVSTAVNANMREDFERSISANGVEDFEIYNVNGTINIESWSGDEIEIHAIKKSRDGKQGLDRVMIEIEEGATVRVTTIHDKNRRGENSFFKRLFSGIIHGGSGVSVDYEIKLPDSVSLKAARSTNGNVRASGVGGIMELKSTNGNIEANRCSGEITARTTNGSIFIDSGSDVKSAHTTNGKIDVALPERIDRDVELRTTNGSITMHLDAGTDADLSCKTTNGKISASGFKMTVETISKRRLEGTLGNGGKRIDAQTTNGSVTLLKQ